MQSATGIDLKRAARKLIASRAGLRSNRKRKATRGKGERGSLRRCCCTRYVYPRPVGFTKDRPQTSPADGHGACDNSSTRAKPDVGNPWMATRSRGTSMTGAESISTCKRLGLELFTAAQAQQNAEPYCRKSEFSQI